MANCGGRHFCGGCGQELIHRDHRRPWESASAFGQIVWREGPRRLTTGDIDHYAAVWLSDGSTLLRLIEHKQPTQRLKPEQQRVLLLLGSLIEHAIHCSNFNGTIDERSGIFLLRGNVTAESNGLRRTFFDGPTAVAKAENGRFVTKAELADAHAIFRWLEGTQGTRKASGPRRNQSLPQPAFL